MFKPEIVGRRKLTNERWLNLFENQVKYKDGQIRPWIYASRKRKEPGFVPTFKPDAVVVIPILVEGDSRKLVVIKEYRAPLEDFEYHFPAGLLDGPENAALTATRELKEETGFKLTKIIRQSPVLSSSGGMTDESAVMVFCECVPDGEQQLEPSENIEVVPLDYAGVCELCRDHSKQIAAKSWPIFYMFEQLGRL